MRKGTKTAAIFGALIIGAALTACGGSADAGTGNSTPIPKSLVGEWYQSNKSNTDVIMQASVRSNDTIQVNMKTRDTSSIYWLGTFKSHKSPKTARHKITSKADQDALAMSIFGSQDASKKFTYKRGVLSFKFTMMGTTSTVEMKQKRTVDVVPKSKIPSSHKTAKPQSKAPKAPAAKVPAAPAKVPSVKR